MTVCGDLSSIADTTVTVTLVVTDETAQQNIDFVVSVVMLIFQPGVTQSCTNIGALDDNALEGDESFTLGLQSTNSLIQISQTAGLTTVTIPNEDSKSPVYIIDSPSSKFSFLIPQLQWHPFSNPATQRLKAILFKSVPHYSRKQIYRSQLVL